MVSKVEEGGAGDTAPPSAAGWLCDTKEAVGLLGGIPGRAGTTAVAPRVAGGAGEPPPFAPEVALLLVGPAVVVVGLAIVVVGGSADVVVAGLVVVVVGRVVVVVEVPPVGLGPLLEGDAALLVEAAAATVAEPPIRAVTVTSPRRARVPNLRSRLVSTPISGYPLELGAQPTGQHPP